MLPSDVGSLKLIYFLYSQYYLPHLPISRHNYLEAPLNVWGISLTDVLLKWFAVQYIYIYAGTKLIINLVRHVT